MFKQYLKQIISQLRSNPLLSSLQIMGSALAIFMIMAYVTMESVNIESFAPESHRDRYLHISGIARLPKDTTQHWESNSHLTTRVFRDCVKEMKTPKAVACFSSSSLSYNVGIAQGIATSCMVKYCNDGFWNVFDFTFLDGRPFNEAEAETGIRVTVINEETARTLFGSIDVCGKDIVINQMPFRVVGVVKNVSSLSPCTYADIWIPYGICEQESYAWNDKNNILGLFSITILANSRDDFDNIRHEFEIMYLKFNESWNEYERAEFRNQPYDQEKFSHFEQINIEPDMESVYRIHFLVIICLLLVPAINLSCMTQSRFRQRMIEIGVRRSFGSTRSSILYQIFFENLILTIVAGLIGLLLCIGFSFVGRDILFAQGISAYISRGETPMVNLNMLMHASTFLWALLFCFILNIMSSCIPAWRISRANIINALKRD